MPSSVIQLHHNFTQELANIPVFSLGVKDLRIDTLGNTQILLLGSDCSSLRWTKESFVPFSSRLSGIHYRCMNGLV